MESNGSLYTAGFMICMCVSLWAWWEVVAAHHRVHDHACCHLQADCLESGISSGPLRSTVSMGTFTFTFWSKSSDALWMGRLLQAWQKVVHLWTDSDCLETRISFGPITHIEYESTLT